MVHRAHRSKPKPIKLFCGLLGREDAVRLGTSLLEEHFGVKDVESPPIPFAFTDYYSTEMGTGLVRQWVAFSDLRERAYLALAKHLAARVELAQSVDGRRSINLDPGYVDDAQVVLSTGKNYAHRIYIGMGYYAEVALVYVGRRFKSLEWTYPDYRSDTAMQFFSEARARYREQVNLV